MLENTSPGERGYHPMSFREKYEMGEEKKVKNVKETGGKTINKGKYCS
jgi:hypothetical protein